MNTKQFLALTLGLATLQATARVDRKFINEIVQNDVQASVVDNNIVITIPNIPNFNADKFVVTVAPDGQSIRFTATSNNHSIKTPATKKGWFGRTINYTIKEEYREQIDITIRLPEAVSPTLARATLRFKDNPQFFSSYDDKINNMITITLPMAKPGEWGFYHRMTDLS